jgi:serine protease Do
MCRRRALHLSLAVALFAAAVTSRAMADPTPGWPDSHSSAYLGVHIEDVTPEQAATLKLNQTNGAVITYVDQDGPACRAGLKSNDVIVGFNGSKVESSEQLGSLIHSTAAGQTITLTIIRSSQSKDMKVALGAWPHMPPHSQAFVAPLPPVAFTGPAMAAPMIPEIDVPSFTVLSSHHGLVVEPLSSQMADYFGVPRGNGVMVRSVEKGSPAGAAGLKACDIIVKINNEPVHDMADWGRNMRVRGGKISMSIMRDKREQTVVISLPAAPNSSRLEDEDWDGLGPQMQAFREEMEKLRPELERSQQEMVAELQPSEKELKQMRHDIEKSMKLQQKDIEKAQKQALKSVPSQQDMEKMRQEIQASMKNLPSDAEMQQMRREVEESMKNWTPQLQHQMEQLRKQILEQQRLNLQEMMEGFDKQHEF